MQNKQDFDVKNLNLYQEISAGGVAIKRENGKTYVVVIEREKMNDHCLPKGHQEAEESLQQTAQRELKEETGFKVKPLSYLGDFTYSVQNDEKKKIVMRTVNWFLMEVVGGKARTPNEEVREVKLIEINEDFSFLTYDNDRMFIERAKKILNRSLPQTENVSRTK